MRKLRFAQAPFEKRARVDAGRRVRLEIDEIPAGCTAFSPAGPARKKMVEADLEQVRRRSVTGDMAAQIGMRAVGAHHHRQRIPAPRSRTGAARARDAGETAAGRQADAVAVPPVFSTGGNCTRRLARMIEQAGAANRSRARAFGFDHASNASSHSRVSRGSASLGLDAPRTRRSPESDRLGHGDFLSVDSPCSAPYADQPRGARTAHRYSHRLALTRE